MPALYLRGNRLTEMHIKLAAYVSEENRLTEIRVILWQLRLTPCVKSYFTAVKTRIWVEARGVKENMRSNERLSCRSNSLMKSGVTGAEIHILTRAPHNGKPDGMFRIF